MLVAVTSRKLKIVSYSVTLVCRKMLLSSTMPQKHSAIFDGLLKMKESMIPTFAVNSQRKRKLKLIYTLGGNRRHALLKVVLPFSLPAIISNMKVNIGLCLVGVIIGEFLAAREGLGYLIIYASQVFKMDWLLMSILLLCLMATLLYSLINLLERWCRKHY